MDDDDLIREFVLETREMLDDAEMRLIEMGKTTADPDAEEENINAVFRAFHSVKGSAGFMQFDSISAVTHEAETLLDLFRKKKLQYEKKHTNTLCKSCDFLRKLLENIDNTLSDSGSEDETKTIVSEIKALISSKPEQKKPAAKPTQQEKPEPSSAEEPAATLTQPAATTEMINLFIQDSEEQLENAEHALLALEKTPEEAEPLMAEVLRSIHTLKGNCGFFNYADLQKLSHKTETVLEGIRDKTIPISDSNVQLLLNMVDILRNALSEVAKGGSGDVQGCDTMLELLDEIIPETDEPQDQPAEDTQPEEQEQNETDDSDNLSAGGFEIIMDEPQEDDKQSKNNEQAEQPVEPEPESKKPEAATQARTETSAQKTSGAKSAQTRRDIRVDVAKLDLLNNLIGELVIGTAMVIKNNDLKGLKLDNFERAAHHMNRITSDLQDVAMSLRMVSIATTLRKMVRLVHDLTNKINKKVDLQLIGEETEVDKNVAELIADPLVHMVRNAVDHGIETPEERKKAGKSETGTLILEAKHQSGEIQLIIKDDGKGLNRDKILAKGIERGLVKGAGENMSEEEIFSLILEPGFSTADKITDVSGRGVGMDVVKKNLEKIRGRVSIQSVPGQGTTFTLRIPLTLAIIQGMLARVAGERYIIPLLSIRESLRATPETVSTITGKGRVISIRGELIPVFFLSKLFDVAGAIEEICEGIVIVVEDRGKHVAIVVDELLGQQEIVIKNLGDLFGVVPGVSGSSILSDGRVGLILDVSGIIGLATT